MGRHSSASSLRVGSSTTYDHDLGPRPWVISHTKRSVDGHGNPIQHTTYDIRTWDLYRITVSAHFLCLRTLGRCLPLAYCNALFQHNPYRSAQMPDGQDIGQGCLKVPCPRILQEYNRTADGYSGDQFVLYMCCTPNTISILYIASSSSSSPETSAFSWPAFAMSWARSCSSVSETALG